MPSNGLVSKITLALGLVGASQAYAQSFTDPITTLGVIASHNRFTVEFDNGEELDEEELNLGGLFYSFGNKLTGQEGLIYQIDAEGQFDENGERTYKSAKAELDIGIRAPLSSHNYLDIVLGGGYGLSQIEQDGYIIGLPGVDIEQTNKLPFAKAGLGYSYLKPSYTLRMEVGARYSINGSIEVDIGDLSSYSVDLENKLNPYGELSFLWNKGDNALAVSTTLYYLQNRYQVENDDSELKQEQIGLRLGLAF